ncbi:MAG: cytochrome P450 [Ilumatobacteraceae bacterium]
MISLDELEADPHPILARLLADAPVCRIDSMDLWFVTRWADVEHVCRHPELFRAATEPSWLRTVLGENMLTLDGAAHDRQQLAMRPPFATATAGAMVRDRLPALFDEQIDTFADRGHAELIADYAEPLANVSLIAALGLRQVAWPDLARWCRGLCIGLANFEDDPTKADVAARAQAELGEALAAELADPSAELAGYLAAGLGHDEIVNNVRLMISGGINEPRDGVGLVMLELLSRPAVEAAVRADRAVLRRVIEETFRYHSPVGTATRQATTDVELSGVTIPRGEMVAAVLTAANRDPRRWPDPDRFDIDRRDGAHLAFATGEHRCLGEWLGRQQVRIGVERLLDRLPGLRLAGEVEVRGFEFRGPVGVPVKWDT